MKKVQINISSNNKYHFILFSKGNTPLHEACFFGRDDAVKELLQAGASWKFVNKLGWTSLHVNKPTSSIH
jgi:ankyrin repeat protein